MTIIRSALPRPDAASLPPGLRVVDADIGNDGNTLFAFGDGTIDWLTFGNGTACKVPHGLWCFRARMFSPELTLVGAGRVRSADEINTWLIDGYGRTVSSFALGDGIENLFRTRSFLVVSYFDEGVFGETPQGNEGLAVFDFDGNFLWGWNGTIASAAVALISDCYSAVPVGDDHVAVFAYTAFDFAILDLQSRKAVVHPTPIQLHGARLSVRSGTAFFCGPYHSPDTIFAWLPGKGDPVVVGSFPRSASTSVRGLSDGRFLTRTESRVELIAVQ